MVVRGSGGRDRASLGKRGSEQGYYRKGNGRFGKEVKSVHEDHVAPARYDISMNVVEGVLNMQPLKEILLSLKKEIDKCLDPLEVGLAFSGGRFVEGPRLGE